MPASSFQQQKLRVCEVCSAYLGLHDNDRRLADHFGGKLHLGFIQIREKLEQLRVKGRLESGARGGGHWFQIVWHCRISFLCRKLCRKNRRDGTRSDWRGGKSGRERRAWKNSEDIWNTLKWPGAFLRFRSFVKYTVSFIVFIVLFYVRFEYFMHIFKWSWAFF